VQHPKYYFFDVGVLNGALGNFVVSPDRIGVLFEHLILQLLKSAFKARDLDVRITCYRTNSGAEVDFIIERGAKIIAVEVKATKLIASHDLRGLDNFSEFVKKKHDSVILYLGEKKLSFDNGVVAWPWAQGLRAIVEKIST
jgi:predicted AAA+ superfamily ATPase